ncbi:MAG: ABC transporter permease [Bradyrhizobium sp.]|uniref:ABC transporter permease n=1 Tax=Bradyrhizobium sp. TaxID=376 RepID=UPI0025C1A3E3|nr:ABC transporter permease [Bradyrhizobium sp.]MBI5264044.1 ABC transporter permease [Bradyrhizobium sp.]
MSALNNVLRLTIKELWSLRYDPALAFFVIYSFTIAIIVPARDPGAEVNNASIAFVDEDRSQLSLRLRDSLRQPYFRAPDEIPIERVDQAMDRGEYTFVVDIPPDFQAKLLAGRNPVVQVNVDATAMSQAFIGSTYLTQIFTEEIVRFVAGRSSQRHGLADAEIRVRFNPNLRGFWFVGVTQIFQSITMLALGLSGAAAIREREHGTLDHLLVMPVGPAEIMLAKIFASGIVILVGSYIALRGIIGWMLSVPLAGSVGLFMAGTVLYVFAVSSISIFLATIARSMPQMGLLVTLIVIPMLVLSGAITPLDSTPLAVQWIMKLTPSPHFVELTTAIVFRGAGLDVVWPFFAAIAVIGAAFFGASLAFFRRSLAAAAQA